MAVHVEAQPRPAPSAEKLGEQIVEATRVVKTCDTGKVEELPPSPACCDCGQASPTIRPCASRSMRSAAELAGSPGIVCVSPQTATTQPAPV
jgi:hypothetical protein